MAGNPGLWTREDGTAFEIQIGSKRPSNPLRDLFFFARFRRRCTACIRIDDLDEAAFLLRALVHQTCALGDLLGEDRELTLRTWNLERFIPDREVALRPLVAAEEDASVTRLFLAHFAVSAEWTVDAQSDCSRKLTVRIIAAGEELSVLAAFDDHGVAAGFALFVGEFFRDDDDVALIVFLEVLGVLALRIA